MPSDAKQMYVYDDFMWFPALGMNIQAHIFTWNRIAKIKKIGKVLTVSKQWKELNYDEIKQRFLSIKIN